MICTKISSDSERHHNPSALKPIHSCIARLVSSPISCVPTSSGLKSLVRVTKSSSRASLSLGATLSASFSSYEFANTIKWGHRTPAGGGECMGAKWKTKLREPVYRGVLTLGPAAHDDGCIFHSRFVEFGEFSAHIVRRPHYPATLYPPQRVLDGRGGVTPGVVIHTPVPLGLAEDAEDVGERVGIEPCLEGSGVAGMRGVYHPNDSDGLARGPCRTERATRRARPLAKTGTR